MNTLENWIQKMPVIAILRGVKPDEVVAIGQAVHRAGIGIIEVPLNSPDPLNSIHRLSDSLADHCIIGAGTVLTLEDVDNIAMAGASIAVSPNTDIDVIQRCLSKGIIPMPGWASASEAFAAYAAGARYLKLFPASSYGSIHVKALSAVLPDNAKVIAVGGVGASCVSEWLQAGIAGIGIGSELYSAGLNATQVFARATEIVAEVTAAIKSAKG